jgi:hypothetical protein
MLALTRSPIEVTVSHSPLLFSALVSCSGGLPVGVIALRWMGATRVLASRHIEVVVPEKPYIF